MPLLFVFFLIFKVQAGYAQLSCATERQSAGISLQRIENEWPLRGSSDPVTQYVQHLGVSLAQLTIAGRSIHWRFFIVRNLAVNAFSIGGGYVFVTEGTINLAQNESELAAVLAHEIGHELAGHFCDDSSASNFGDLFDIFSPPVNRQYREDIGSMTLIIDPIKEQQADRIALSILQAGRFNPHAMLDMARRLPPGSSGHFVNAVRIQALQKAVAALPVMPAESSGDFMKIKSMLREEHSGG